MEENVLIDGCSASAWGKELGEVWSFLYGASRAVKDGRVGGWEG